MFRSIMVVLQDAIRQDAFRKDFCGMRWLTSFTAQSLADETTSDATQPGAEFLSLAQQAQMLPRSNERFLGKVLALAEAARSAVREGANQPLITGNDVAEGIA